MFNGTFVKKDRVIDRDFQIFLNHFPLVNGRSRMVKDLSCNICTAFTEKKCPGHGFKGRQCTQCLKRLFNIREIRICSEWWLDESSERYKYYEGLFLRKSEDYEEEIPKPFMKVLKEKHGYFKDDDVVYT